LSVKDNMVSKLGREGNNDNNGNNDDQWYVTPFLNREVKQKQTRTQTFHIRS